MGGAAILQEGSLWAGRISSAVEMCSAMASSLAPVLMCISSFSHQNMWIERTTYTTAYSFPGILKWFEVKHTTTVSSAWGCTSLPPASHARAASLTSLALGHVACHKLPRADVHLLGPLMPSADSSTRGSKVPHWLAGEWSLLHHALQSSSQALGCSFRLRPRSILAFIPSGRTATASSGLPT